MDSGASTDNSTAIAATLSTAEADVTRITQDGQVRVYQNGTTSELVNR